MSDVLHSLSRLSMVAFLLASMLGIGLSLTLSQIIAPLRSLRLVTAVLVANCLIVPLIAVGTVRLFRLEEPFAIGLLLLGLAPGAPFLPKIVELTKGDVALAVGLMVLLMAASVVCLPLALPQLLPGVTIGLWQIARPLLLLMVLPLLTGLVCKARFARVAAYLRTGVHWLSNGSLLLVVVLVVTMNLPSVLRVFGTGAIGAGILFTALAGLAGRLLGGAGIPRRKVLVLGTGLRNIAAALVIAEEDFRDPQVLVMLVIAAFAGLFLLVPITLAWGKGPAARPALTH